MNKFCLTLLMLLSIAFVKGQSSALPTSFTDLNINSAAINISIPKENLSDGDVYFEEAEQNEKHGELHDALTFFGKAAFEYNNEKQISKYAGSLLRMSQIHMLLSNYLEAEQVVLNAALKTYAKIGSRSGQMASYLQLAKIYFAANKLPQSMWFYTQQGMLAKKLFNNGAYIESVIGIANVKIKKKEYKLATLDLNNAEILAKNYRISQYNQQIKQIRALIAEKTKKS